jgi:hypothetical protein
MAGGSAGVAGRNRAVPFRRSLDSGSPLTTCMEYYEWYNA